MRWALIAGQMKAATTTLHDALGQHPDVVSAVPKETEWWRYPGVSPRVYRRLFLKGDPAGKLVLDGSVAATRAQTPVEDVLRGLEALGPPAAVVYVVREAPKRILSQTIHALFLEQADRGEEAVRRCFDDALATSDVQARLRPLLDALPQTRFVIVRFRAIHDAYAETLRALQEALGLAERDLPPTHRNTKADQRPLWAPIRVIPGRARLVWLARKVLGHDRSRKFRAMISVQEEVPADHPPAVALVQAEAARIAELERRNQAFLSSLKKDARVVFLGDG